MRGTAGIVATSAAAGALAAWLLDPQSGRRRRAVARDRIRSRLHRLDDAARIALVDLRNRTAGTIASVCGRAAAEDDTDDPVLAERVRATLGRVVSHPGSIDVSASAGVVTLRGPVLQHETASLLRAVRAVRGVRAVDDRLDAHECAGRVSGLQGGRPRARRIDVLQKHWAPATRLLVGAGGAALALYGFARRSALAPLLAAGGAALVARAANGVDAKRLPGRRGSRGIDFRKSIFVSAPIDEVFAFWSDFGNFPRFMRNVREVRRNSGGHWHWVVAGPLGTTTQWDAEVTRNVPNECLSWATTSGSRLRHAGTVRFLPENGGTRVDIEMTYVPPAGATGHALASLFGADPGAGMGEDLVRAKRFLETGKPARDAAKPVR